MKLKTKSIYKNKKESFFSGIANIFKFIGKCTVNILKSIWICIKTILNFLLKCIKYIFLIIFGAIISISIFLVSIGLLISLISKAFDLPQSPAFQEIRENILQTMIIESESNMKK